MAKTKTPKTNALRALDSHRIEYKVRTYEAPVKCTHRVGHKF